MVDWLNENTVDAFSLNSFFFTLVLISLFKNRFIYCIDCSAFFLLNSICVFSTLSSSLQSLQWFLQLYLLIIYWYVFVSLIFYPCHDILLSSHVVSPCLFRNFLSTMMWLSWLIWSRYFFPLEKVCWPYLISQLIYVCKAWALCCWLDLFEIQMCLSSKTCFCS